MKLLKACTALLCSAAIFTGLTGCSQKGAASAKGGASGARKNIVIWDYFETDSQKVMMKWLCDGFNNSQDEFTARDVYVPFADYEKQLTLGMASGQLPDIVILDGCDMASFIELGLFADVTDQMKDMDWDAYIKGPLSSTMKDGRHYGMPFCSNCTALIYNKDILDKAGVPYPDENTTWEDFHKMAKKLSDSGVTGFGNAATNTDEGTFQCLQWLYTAGGDYLNIEKGIDAFRLMQDMQKDGSWSKEVVNWTQSDVNYNFMAGNLAMEQNGPWQVPVFATSAPELNYGVTVLPKRDKNSGQATSILGGENMGAVKKADVSGAVAFMKYYDNTDVMIETMKIYGSFPPKTEASKNEFWTKDPVMSAFIQQLQTSIPRGPSASWPQYSAAIQNGFQQVLSLTKTPEQAAADTQKGVDAVK